MPDIPHVDVASLKVAELKDELKKRGMPVSGLKKDLADRLQEAQDRDLTGVTEDSAPAKDVKDDAEPLKAPSPALHEDNEAPAANGSAVSEAKAAEPNGADTKEPVKNVETQEPPVERHSPLPELMEPPPSISKEVTPEPLEAEIPVENDGPPVVADGKGVGDAMIDGEEGAQLGKAAPVEPSEEKAVEDLQPESLDVDVAETVARTEMEERKEGNELKITPPLAVEEDLLTVASGSRSARPSALREPQPSRGQTSPRPALGEESRDIDMNDRPAKRAREEDDAPPSKRVKSTYTTPLPRSLSHLSHPPTSNLYITNLRRPLLIPALHDYLLPARHPADLLPSPKGPFASDEYPGLWLSGIKDHAYATYPSVEDALETAEKVDGRVWPEETGEKLRVEFIPDEELKGLVEREEFAWANGRQKLSLKITREDDDVRFELVGGAVIGGARGQGQRGSIPGHSGPGAGPPRGPAGVPLSGANSIGAPGAVGAPTGPSRGMPIRGRGGLGQPIGLGRSDPGLGGAFGRPMAGAAGRLANPMKRTIVRPSLFYREGPGEEA